MQMMPPISYFWKFADVAPWTSVSGAWTRFGCGRSVRPPGNILVRGIVGSPAAPASLSLDNRLADINESQRSNV
jgi:hypothetical protein